MIHLQRGPAPDFWTRERVKAWTQSWLDKNCESVRWDWPQYQTKKLNHYAQESMETWHHQKCAFCEVRLGRGEIEHFRSKTQYPLAAFVWRNLFLICTECNRAKNVQDHEGCLKPDRENPASYLWINPISLKMEPQPNITVEDHQRALKTIERYGLDRPELSRLYREYLNKTINIHLLRLAGLIAQAEEDNLQAKDKISMSLAGLRGFAQPEQPFSLMIKSLLQYYAAM